MTAPTDYKLDKGWTAYLQQVDDEYLQRYTSCCVVVGGSRPTFKPCAEQIDKDYRAHRKEHKLTYLAERRELREAAKARALALHKNKR